MSGRRRKCLTPRGRRGFSLVEVIMAIVLLSGVLLGFAVFTQRMAHGNATATTRSTESDLAVDRLETVRAATDYASIDAFGVAEPTIAGFAGYTRSTYVLRTVTTAADHKTVTVVVAKPSIHDSVVKTTVIAAF